MTVHDIAEHDATDDERDDERQCECGAAMVHRYGPIEDRWQGDWIWCGYWWCRECDATTAG